MTLMKHTEQFNETQSSDPVLREMAYIADRILNDPTLNRLQRAKLIQRLEAEYHAYKAWKKQYASYFRTPRSRITAERNFNSSKREKGQR